MIEVRRVPGDTGRLLVELLREREIDARSRDIARAEAIVSYGCRVESGLPTLNANAGRLNKFEELTRLKEKGVCVPPFCRGIEDAKRLTFPILGRKFHHSKARDIVPILQNDQEFGWRVQGGACDFFVQYVAKKREFRVWAYRRQSLAVYEKVMRYPERYRVGRDAGIGWNWEHGFAFEFVEADQRPEGLVDLGTRAVDAMDLDFGAVDIIEDMDGRMYVLEVNTAPGVQDRRQGIVALADKIAKWKELGYPKRRGVE